jgi:hypothetical protein
MKYSMLYSYRNLQFPNTTLAKFSWWQKYKFNRSIIKELPKYDSHTGKAIDWNVNWAKKIYKHYDIFTGKVKSKKITILSIDIHGYVEGNAMCGSDRYNYDLSTGKMYYETWSGFSGYTPCNRYHTDFDIDKD